MEDRLHVRKNDFVDVLADGLVGRQVAVQDVSGPQIVPSEVFDISQSHSLKREGENDECKHLIGIVGLLANVGPISEDRRGDDGTDPG